MIMKVFFLSNIDVENSSQFKFITNSTCGPVECLLPTHEGWEVERLTSRYEHHTSEMSAIF